MVANDHGGYDSMSEEEFEVQAHQALANKEAELDEQELLSFSHDANPSLVITRVLTTQASSEEDQRCNLFQTKARINGRSIRVIIDGGSCHNLES